MEPKERRPSQRWDFRPFFALRCWWKRRRFQYLQQVNTHDDSPKDDDDGYIDELNDTASSAETFPPHALYFNVQESLNHRLIEPREYFNVQEMPNRRRHQDELSIESMDSLVDSTCDVNDEASLATKQISNLHRDHVLMTHLAFLSESTRPQQVDLMYETLR